jgi:xanthine phosphoribosyltransferase
MSTPPLYHLTWDEFHRDTRALAARLVERPWRGVVGIARGGLIPAAIIARELDVRLIDSLCIASYDHTRQGEPQILKGVDGDGEGLLVVDDLVDTGVTAQLAKVLLPRATLVAVYAKPRGMPKADLWGREFSQDTWIHFPWDVTHSYAEPLIKQLKQDR